MQKKSFIALQSLRHRARIKSKVYLNIKILPICNSWGKNAILFWTNIKNTGHSGAVATVFIILLVRFEICALGDCYIK